MRRLRVLVLTTVLLAACSDGHDARRDTARDLDDDDPIEITAVPDAYRITYRVTDGDRTTTERITVRRPFESRIETWEGDDTDGEPATTEIASFGRTARVTSTGQRVAVAVPPALAPGDVRIDSILDAAIQGGMLVARGQREVLDRPCQVYRTGQTLRLVELATPSGEAHADVCVDAAGLVLEEVDGDRRRVAIALELDPDVDDGAFDVGDRTIPVREGGGVVTELTGDSRPPGTFFELADDLAGLERIGRYAVVPPQPDAFTDPLQRGRRIASVADVLRDGDVDLLVVERGGSLGGEDVVPDATNAETVDVGEVGDGQLLLTAGGPELTIELDGGRFVRLSGTTSIDDLLEVARGLHEVPGGELTTVGTPW